MNASFLNNTKVFIFCSFQTSNHVITDDCHSGKERLLANVPHFNVITQLPI